MLNRYVAMLERAGLAKCVLLAVASSALWYVLYGWASLGSDPLVAWPGTLYQLPAWLLVWFTGSIYGALVLFRYIGVDARARAWAFVVGGTLTYCVGVNVVWWGPMGNAAVDLPISGAITAGIVGLLVIRFGTLRFSPLSFVALCGAGGLGGVLIGVFFYLYFGGTMARFDGDRTGLSSIEPTVWFFVGHAAWQVLTCIALYFTPRSHALRAE